MKLWILQYNGETLSEWRIPASWEPVFGSLVALIHDEHLKLFRVIGSYGNAILLQIA